jgi:phosphoribosyl 1,2-cyclic phosphate phosphodiesterase
MEGKVTFLGTGTSQGVPIIGCTCPVCSSSHQKDKRLRSSILIQTEKTSVVIDTGPDFRQQMLRARVNRLDAVVFTHGHKDHTAGFDDIRAFNFLQKKDMNVYLDKPTECILRKDFDYVFEAETYPGVPRAQLFHLNGEPFQIGDLEFNPIQVYHYKMPVYGFRFGDFTYITDANRIPQEEKEKIKGSKTLVLNALRKEDHISHFTLKQAMELADELGAEKTYFTHISHQMGLHEEVQETLPSNCELAYDELTLTFN